MPASKREFFTIEKTIYRNNLLTKVRAKGPFAGLDTSTIFEKLLELYDRNPAIAEESNSQIKDIELQSQIFLEIVKKIDELLTVNKTIDQRLQVLENQKGIQPVPEGNLFDNS